LSTLARAIVRWWWAVIALWVGLAGTLFVIAPPFAEVATFDDTAFLPEGTPAIEGGQLLAEGWPDDDFGRTAAVALVRSDGELTRADARYARSLIDWIESDDSPAALGSVTTHYRDRVLADVFVSEDGQATYLLAGLEVPPFTPPANEAIATLREHIDTTAPPDGLQVHVTGSAAVAADESAAIESSVTSTHLITLLLVTAILVWVYRSPVTPLIPLVTIGVAFVTALSTVSLLAQAGMQVTSLFETFSIVIIFGAGTDYCLFLISRYHEELDQAGRAGYVRDGALRRTTLTASVWVLALVLGSSAMTTIVGFSAQSVAEFGMYRTMGPAMAIAVAITLIVAVTLTPALMRLFGPYLFWPDRGIRGEHGTDDLLIERQAIDTGDLTRAGAP
jgi:putative drug exporter of the RND superfamily